MHHTPHIRPAMTPEQAFWADYFRQCRAEAIRHYQCWLDRPYARRRALHMGRLARMMERTQ